MVFLATPYDNLRNPSWDRLVQTAKQVSNSLNKGLRPQSEKEAHPLEANAAVSGVDTAGLCRPQDLHCNQLHGNYMGSRADGSPQLLLPFRL
jgi:hypothetical protein